MIFCRQSGKSDWRFLPFRGWQQRNYESDMLPVPQPIFQKGRVSVQISQFFINGDIRGAIAYMRCHAEFRDILPAYVAVFENREYRTYPVPDFLNEILCQYQIYCRDIFYCGLPETEAAGYHALFGKTQGYYGPYIWRDTVPTVYRVELPEGTADYTVNILDGFVFRGWMDCLTFGRYGTGGWTSPDGTINCIRQAYDFESERFLVSLLKHEAQHAADMKRFPGITPAELEYRAKLVELHYSGDAGLLQKFLSEADENKANDSHAVASTRISREFGDTDQTELSAIRTRALELLHAHTEEMKEKYGKLA